MAPRRLHVSRAISVLDGEAIQIVVEVRRMGQRALLTELNGFGDGGLDGTFDRAQLLFVEALGQHYFSEQDDRITRADVCVDFLVRTIGLSGNQQAYVVL